MISLPHNILSALNAKHRTSLRQFAQHVQSLYTWTTPPEFNDHGPEHIGRVLQQFSSLFLRPARRRAGELSEFETYLAAVAIVAHDIGMIYGRDNHAAVAANILNAARQQFEYVTAGNVHVIELIARAVSTHSSSADLNSV